MSSRRRDTTAKHCLHEELEDGGQDEEKFALKFVVVEVAATRKRRFGTRCLTGAAGRPFAPMNMR